jgi:hypothetical protein
VGEIKMQKVAYIDCLDYLDIPTIAYQSHIDKISTGGAYLPVRNLGKRCWFVIVVIGRAAVIG